MDRAAALAPSVGDVDPAGWLDRLEDMFGRVLAPAFARREPRPRGPVVYLLGLAPRARHARTGGRWRSLLVTGRLASDGMQRLLDAAAAGRGAAAEWDQSLRSAGRSERADLHGLQRLLASRRPRPQIVGARVSMALLAP